MICFPYLFNLSCKKYDFIFVDEAQDLNSAQTDLILRSIKPNGRIIAVGDTAQAIYGFRGADTESILKLTKLLDATTLPLSISYRCPKSHIRLAQQYVPAIEAAPGAKEGKVINLSEDDLYKYIKPGDLAICRNNAPLVKPCLSLLKRGIKATIKGRDIGKNLATLVKNFRARTIPELKQLIDKWEDNEIERASKKNQNPQLIEDKADCLYSFIANSGAKTPAQLIEYIKAIFSDDKAEIVFSSIHKAKGLESKNVFFLQPSLIPSKYAEQEWELIQEHNLYYVAITRAKESLYMVS
jgi:DNA helicase-2/ATP-dependent DNA helicase PcrA